MQLTKEQLDCAAHCLDKKRRMAAVTGPAGTGKTTLIKYIAEQLAKEGVDYAVASPTGKAAKRIRELTGIRAITIHKLLEYGRPGERDKKTGEPLDITVPKRGRMCPFDQRVILVDEYSMVTHELNRNLIDALPSGGRLIMFGDISQLPPVESYVIKTVTGSPFKEHLERNGIAFKLTEIFRQVEGGDILAAATNIRKGVMPKRGGDFRVRYTMDPVSILQDLVFEAQDAGIDYASIDNQILTPLRTRWIGTGPLNVMLRRILNPRSSKDGHSLPRYEWDEKNPVTISVGDKVVCTENTYDMRGYYDRFTKWDNEGRPELHSFIPTPETKYMLNGETGVVLDIYPDGGIEVDFGDRVVEIPYTYEEYWMKKGIVIDTFPQRQIDLAYAITVHKAQGSEYSNIIYVINSSIFYMLSRENMYTAITRASKTATLITDQRALRVSLQVTQEVIGKRQRERGSLIKS